MMIDGVCMLIICTYCGQDEAMAGGLDAECLMKTASHALHDAGVENAINNKSEA